MTAGNGYRPLDPENEIVPVDDIRASYQALMSRLHEVPDGADILATCLGLAHMLFAKNTQYGNSALAPVRVFSNTESEAGQPGSRASIAARMDDKLSRIKNTVAGSEANEAARGDLCGYLILDRIAYWREHAQGEI